MCADSLLFVNYCNDKQRCGFVKTEGSIESEHVVAGQPLSIGLITAVPARECRVMVVMLMVSRTKLLYKKRTAAIIISSWTFGLNAVVFGLAL